MPEVTVLTYVDPVGESLVAEKEVRVEVVGEPQKPGSNAVESYKNATLFETTATDTRCAVEEIASASPDVILFVGGDGTVADVATAVQDYTDRSKTGGIDDIPILAVPAGVKVHSSIFVVSPEDAATVLSTFERTEEREIIDIDEDEYRRGEASPNLNSVVQVHVEKNIQPPKQLSDGTVPSPAEGVSDNVMDC